MSYKTNQKNTSKNPYQDSSKSADNSESKMSVLELYLLNINYQTLILQQINNLRIFHVFYNLRFEEL